MVIASNVDSTPRGIYPDESEEPIAMVVGNSTGRITQTAKPFGDAIMVIPGAQIYEVEVLLSQAGFSGGNITQKMPIDFSAQTNPNADRQAVSGHQYDVTITVYGREKVEIDVEMSSWEGGHGQFELDPDNY